jgi:DNA-binding transcriptional MerR regulator
MDQKDTKQGEYHHQDILRIFPDINPRTLISWVEKRIIKPLAEPETRGGKRVYSYQNLMEIAFVRELALYFGMSFKYIQLFMKNKDLQRAFQTGEYTPVYFRDVGHPASGIWVDIKLLAEFVDNALR